MRVKPHRVWTPGADYEIEIRGARATPLRFYHALLRASWGVTLAAISATWVAANALFALL